MLRVGVMGAGAIGCFVGGKLQAAGTDVAFVGRLGDEIRRHGLTLTELDGKRTVVGDVRYTDDVGTLANRDVVLVTVKSPATEAAGRSLAGVLAPGAVVVSLQNGVRNPETLRAALPERVVVPGMVPFNVLNQGEGRFHRGTSGPLELGAQGGVEQPLVDALRTAGFDVVVRDDLLPVLWTKLLVNLGNSINALAGIPLREQLRQRGYRRVYARAMAEGLACLRAEGVAPVRIGRLIPALAPTVLALPDWLFLRVAAAMVDIDPHARSSMWEDLTRGRPTEIDYLNGEIVRLGERRGIPTPVNRRIVELVKAAEGHGSPGIAAEELEGRVGA